MVTLSLCKYSGNIASKIEDCWQFIKKIGIGSNFNKKPLICTDIASRAREMDYIEEYQFMIENSCFNIILNDHSFFFFSQPVKNGVDEYSFSFYESPSVVPTFEEYIQEVWEEDTCHGEFYNDPSLYSDYEQYVLECKLKRGITPVRYDYSIEGYEAGRHPVSHLHIGYDNDVRIFVDRILNPLSFVALILRQHYPSVWRQQVLNNHTDIIENQIRNKLKEVASQHRHDLDKYEMILK